MCWSRSSTSSSASCRCTGCRPDGAGEELGQDAPLERELALVKVAGTGDARVEALRLADAFRAKVIDANTEHFIFEITGKRSKIEQFIAIMKPLGLVEICRTGVAAMNRGPQGM
jgi:acetolactate synthase-1/3 small subunit